MGRKTMKILVLGNGYIGSKIIKYFNADFLEKRIEDMVKEDFVGYDVVINTIAKTNVDWCEENDCYEVNTNQAIRIGKLVDGKYVFISTACIFPKPLCEYAWSKVKAEQGIEKIENHLIIRPRLPISNDEHQKNTLTKILNYKTLSTTKESFTIVEDMLEALEKLLLQDARGTYNVINDGSISPSEIADIFMVPHDKKTHQEIQSSTGKVPRTSVVLKPDVEMPDITKRIKQLYESKNT